MKRRNRPECVRTFSSGLESRVEVLIGVVKSVLFTWAIVIIFITNEDLHRFHIYMNINSVCGLLYAKKRNNNGIAQGPNSPRDPGAPRAQEDLTTIYTRAA